MPHFDFTRQCPQKLELHFQGWEPEVAPKAIVCLVHGLGEHAGRYGHVTAALNEAGYAVLGFDLCGHGRSGGPRGLICGYDAVMEDVGRLLDEAAVRYEGKPCFLYGHSMGGGLVLNYALRRGAAQGQGGQRSLAGVIATSPALRTAAPPPAAKVTFGRILYRLRPQMQMANGLDLSGLSRDPAVIEAYVADPLVHDQVSARLGVDLLQCGEWALAHAAEFPPVPLLLVHGTATGSPLPRPRRSSPARYPASARQNCGMVFITRHTTSRRKRKS